MEHTLENLAPLEKEKLIQLVKQLNDLKTMCMSYEQEVQDLKAGNSNLVGQNDALAQRLEAVQKELVQALEDLRMRQAGMARLNAKWEKSVGEKNQLAAELQEARDEAEAFRLRVAELEAQRRAPKADIGVQATRYRLDVGTVPVVVGERREAATQVAADLGVRGMQTEVSAVMRIGGRSVDDETANIVATLNGP